MADKPSGLTIARKNTSFDFTWKRPKSYTAQKFGYAFVTSKSAWTKAQKYLDKKQTPKNISFSPYGVTGSQTKVTKSQSYSNTTHVYGVIFRVRGIYTRRVKYKDKKGHTKYKEERKTSAWSYKTMTLKAPNKPKASSSWDDQIPTASTFSWENTVKDNDTKPFSENRFQSVRVEGATYEMRKEEATWEGISVSSATADGSRTYTDTGLDNTKSYTRFFRVLASGLQGQSEWAYAWHTYATPYAPIWKDYTVDYDANTHAISIFGRWTVPQDFQHPVDTHTLQYCTGVPSSNGALPANPTWNDVETQAIPSDTDYEYIEGDETRYAASSHIISQTLEEDECVWLRVKATHDNRDTYSAIVRANLQKLSPPENVSITYLNTDTHIIAVAATNTSQVSNSRLAVVFVPSDNPEKEVTVGIMSHSATSLTGIKCPAWTPGTLGIKVYAFVGDAPQYQTLDGGVRAYTVKPIMTSDFVQVSEAEGTIPIAPVIRSVSKSEDDSEALTVEWEYSWAAATGAEISWSEKKNAWNSTNEPERYTVDNINGARFDIGGLTPGETYYVRVRLISENGDNISYSPYSEMVACYLSEAPAVPFLQISEQTIRTGETGTVSWTYTSMDGTPQACAQLAEKVNGTYGAPFVTLNGTGQSYTLNPAELGWTPGSTHQIGVCVTSESGLMSKFSDAVTVNYAAPLTVAITQSSLVLNQAGFYELKAMPFTVTVTGASNAGHTVITVTRMNDYVQDRPDELEFNGFAGELILKRDYMGQSQQTFTNSDPSMITGAMLDDTAWYTLTATVYDEFGQSASVSRDFLVAWTEQAVVPAGSVEITDGVAYITVPVPDNMPTGSTVDIYRLSVDKPELIYRDARPAADTIIVDPYPSTGPLAGYRLVLKTANGDYTTAAEEFAWLDIETNYESPYQYIDFNGYQLALLYNVELSNQFEKDYNATKYLGGSIVGDWLAGVRRTGSISSVIISENDVEDLRMLRRLATYSGPAHIRTKDGSSYWANIQASDGTGYQEAGKPYSVNLTVEQTDTAELDGLHLSIWV